jgi:hypothetical protein
MSAINTPMDEETEKALREISNEVITANVIFKDDNSELEVSIAVGSNENLNDDDVFYYLDNTNELRSLLKGSNNWEHNKEDFYIQSFTNGKVYWKAND